MDEKYKGFLMQVCDKNNEPYLIEYNEEWVTLMLNNLPLLKLT